MIADRSSRLKAVGIGAGYFARFQYDAWARIPEVDVAAICDRVEGKARAMADQFAVPHIYTDWKEMIDRERPDFVDIITPPRNPRGDVRFCRSAWRPHHLPEARGAYF